MIKQISSSLTILFAGIVIGISGTLFFSSYNPVKVDPKTVNVDNISGGKLSIVDVLRTKTSTTIDAKYDSEGESRITIPNTYYKYSVCSFISTDRSIYVGGGYNFGRFQAIGGVWFRNNSGYACGVWFGGLYQF